MLCIGSKMALLKNKCCMCSNGVIAWGAVGMPLPACSAASYAGSGRMNTTKMGHGAGCIPKPPSPTLEV